ncbi:MAG: alkaline phosphatase D family protein, partial [Pseudomonadales bacterium]|nr:alkaline phosphatase D family protein [Pseudomonadales bacterium]
AVFPEISPDGWSIDEIGQFDLPPLVQKVFAASGQQPVNIFAHCVGASALQMAILKGWIPSAQIGRVAFNAIHPWVITSPANRLRAKFGGFFRNIVNTTMLDPVPGPADTFLHGLMDRIAFFASRLAEPAADRHEHFGDQLTDVICDRMTLLYGRMWNHRNLTPATHRAFRDMLGVAPAGVYRHIYYLSVRERVVNCEGRNDYLTAENITGRWQMPTLFIHGEQSQVFNPHAARRSAVRLGRLTDPDRQKIGYRIYPGNGHMDPIIGKRAYTEVYPELELFFRAGELPQVWQEEDDPVIAKPALILGPAIRSAWAGATDVRIRLWGEIERGFSSGTRTLSLADKTHETIGKDFPPVPEKATSARGTDLPVTETELTPQWQRLLDIAVDPAKPEPVTLTVVQSADPEAITNVTLPLHQEPWFQRLATGDERDQFSLLAGSCRFPGLWVDQHCDDLVYGAMLQHIAAQSTGDSVLRGVDMVLMVGDQIYADATDQLFHPQTLREKYRYRYRQALSHQRSPHINELLARVPVHIAIDDHEIVDNWSGVPDHADRQNPADNVRHEKLQTQFRYAVKNAHRYQGAGRSVRPVAGSPKGVGFSYALSSHEAPLPVFVMDTRTERDFRSAPGQPDVHLISSAQQLAFTAWLDTA